MPRRKIGADLKEALCKLYEAGDISADTIEKHGIMSRATFFRNLKMYKSGASLEQRHSTGRKTNADKLREQERLELDALEPAHLSHLELVLLLDEDDRTAQNLAAKKRKAKPTPGSSKRKETAKGTSSESHAQDVAGGVEDSESDSDAEVDDSAHQAKRQAIEKLAQAAKAFLSAPDASNGGAAHNYSRFADLDSLVKPEDSHYSHGNRGALYIVRRKSTSGKVDGNGEIIAAIALRSLIWTPEIYQALSPGYANRSIDKICNLAHVRVDPLWQRQGVGTWLVKAAELKASKLGFSHLYTQSDGARTDLISFWRCTGFSEFARLDNVARLEKAIAVPSASKAGGSKRVILPSSPSSAGTANIGQVASSSSSASALSAAPDGVGRGAGLAGHPRTRMALSEKAESHASRSVSDAASVTLAKAVPAGSAPSTPSFPSTTPSAATMSSVLPSSTAPTSSTLDQESVTIQPYAPPGPRSAVPSAEQSTLSTAMGRPSATVTPAQQKSNSALSGPPPRRIAFHEAD